MNSNEKLLNITELELEIASLQSKIKLYEIRITRLKLSIPSDQSSENVLVHPVLNQQEQETHHSYFGVP